MVWNELFLLTPSEDEVLCIWYPKRSVEVRFHFRVRVWTSFRWQTEEHGGARPEHRDLHITRAQKEGSGGVCRVYGKDPNGGTWRGPEEEQRDLESSGTLMEELGGDQSLKEMSEGVKEGKRCGLEISGTQMEVSGGDWRRPYPLTGSCNLAGLRLSLHWPEFPQYFSELVCGVFFVDFFSYLILCHQLGTPIFNYNSCDIYRQNNLA